MAMHFTIDLDIQRPLNRVWSAFIDRSVMPHWQSTLRAIEPVHGGPAQIGAMTRLHYREAGRDVVIEETVVSSTPPTTLVARLASSLMHSTMGNTFSPTPDGGTRWRVECDIQFRGIWKLFGLLGRRTIVGKTLADMERFKQLVESSVLSADPSASCTECPSPAWHPAQRP